MASSSTPLDLLTREIRLLSIQPGVWKDEILCTLNAVSLDEEPRYDALSYAWGDSKITLPIMINKEPFEVTTTVCSALRRLRQKKEIRVIWIDQICIDQDNNTEKTHQVSIMAEIYKSAQHVWIWLGDEEETKERGFNERPLTVEDSQSNFKLRRVKRKALQHQWAHKLKRRATKNRCHDWEALSLAFDFIYSVVDDAHFYETSYFDRNLEETIHHRDLVCGLKLIAKRTWWDRVWVVQETCLAISATVILGSRTIRWSQFEQWVSNMRSHDNNKCCRTDYRSMASDEWQALLVIRDSIRTIGFCRHDNDQPLLEMLWATESKKSKDSRDKVYGLLGLMSGGGDSNSISPDYSLNTLQVYTKVVEAHIQRHRDLSFLCNLPLGPLEFPSWVPDWSVTDARDTSNQLICTYYQSWMEETNAMISKHGETLSVDGIFLDTVSWCATKPFSGNSDEIEGFKVIEEFYQALFQKGALDCEYIMDGKAQEAFFRTLICDVFVGGGIHRAAPDFLIIMEEWWQRCFSARKLHSASDSDSQVWRSVWNTTISPRSRLFITQQGYVGKGPPLMSVGDQVFILRGCRMAIILRPATEHEFIGADGPSIHSRCLPSSVLVTVTVSWTEKLWSDSRIELS